MKISARSVASVAVGACLLASMLVTASEAKTPVAPATASKAVFGVRADYPALAAPAKVAARPVHHVSLRSKAVARRAVTSTRQVRVHKARRAQTLPGGGLANDLFANEGSSGGPGSGPCTNPAGVTICGTQHGLFDTMPPGCGGAACDVQSPGSDLVGDPGIPELPPPPPPIIINKPPIDDCFNNCDW